jgi:hypothetical protein
VVDLFIKFLMHLLPFQILQVLFVYASGMYSHINFKGQKKANLINEMLTGIEEIGMQIMRIIAPPNI